MGVHYERARLLFDQSRYEQAERELRGELAENPHFGQAHAFLGRCLGRQKRLKEALEEGEEGVRLAPDLAYAHYMLSATYHDLGRLEEAEASVREALRLEPRNADQISWLSWILGQRGDQRAALAAADQGLEIDPQHIPCLQRRGSFLRQLGDWKESESTLRTALALKPDDDFTHASLGWTLWSKAYALSGNPRPVSKTWAVSRRPELGEAMDHFREALRQSPGHDWARTGLEEILLTRTKAVLILLMLFITLAAAILLRLYVQTVPRGRAASGQDFPSGDPVFWGLFLAFLGAPTILFSNGTVYLLMRAGRLGETVLSPARRRAAKAAAICLVAAAGAALLGLLVVSVAAFGLLCFTLAFFSLALIAPLTLTCEATRRWNRRLLMAYVVLLAIGGVVAITFMIAQWNDRDAVAVILVPAALLATAASLGSLKLARYLEKAAAKKKR